MSRQNFNKLSPFTNLDKLWYTYLASDVSERSEIKQLIELLNEKNLRESYSREKIVLKPPTKEASLGEFLIGEIYYGEQKFYPFGLRQNELTSHLGIFGRTGSGKTSLVMLFLLSLTNKIPFLLFDWKHEYSTLKAKIGNLKVLNAGNSNSSFKWNPFVPPIQQRQEEYQNYLKDLATLFVNAYFPNLSLLSLEGMKILFIQTFDRLCKSLKTYRNSGKFPTFGQAFSILGEHSKSLAFSHTALKSCLHSLCFGSINTILNSPTSIDLKEILLSPTIIELQSCGSESDKRFLTNALLYWIYKYRLHQGKTDNPRHIIVMEEAHHHQGELLERIFRMIRAYGQSLLFIDQHPSLISIPIFGNMYATISLNLKHEDDIVTIAKTMGLDEIEREYLRRLSVGQAIVKLQGRHHYPFLIHFPLVKLPSIEIEDNDKKDNKKDVYCFVTPEEVKFLYHIIKYPQFTAVERYKALNINPRKGNDIQTNLINKGLILKNFHITSQGRINFLKVTEKGKKVLEAQDFPVNRTKRHGGAIHQYTIEKILSNLRKKGHKAQKECPIGSGKTVDIMLFYENQKIAIEVETGHSDFTKNVYKCLNLGYPVIIVATDESLEKRIQKWADEKGFSKKQVKVIKI